MPSFLFVYFVTFAMTMSSESFSILRDPRGSRTSLSYIGIEASGIRVSDWGQSMRQEVEHIRGLIHRVNYWDILWVDVYVRDFGYRNYRFHGARTWIFYSRYPVKECSEVRRVVDEHLGTAGLCKRVSFHVEQWMWSIENGWEVDDQV